MGKRTLIIMEDGQEVERAEGTFAAFFPSDRGLRVMAEGDLSGALDLLKMYAEGALRLLMIKKSQ
jgi:hypothetical protein